PVWQVGLLLAGFIFATFCLSFGFCDEKATAEAAKPQPPEELDPRMNLPDDWREAIEDDAKLKTEKENRREYYAYNEFVTHAHKFPPDLLAKHTRKELTFQRLFSEEREKYRGEIVRVEGRL